MENEVGRSLNNAEKIDSVKLAEIEKGKPPISVDLAYASEPWWYDARGFLILTFAYRSTLPAQLRLFSQNISDNHLEVAIGSGTLLNLCLLWRRIHNQTWKHIVGFDYSSQMLSGAVKRFKKDSRIQLFKEDAANLPWADCSFDSANVANSLHSFPELEKSLGEIYRVLKPGATLAGNCLLYPGKVWVLDRISTWINHWGMRKGILHRPYDKQEVKEKLVGAGFLIQKEVVRGNCYDFIVRKVKP